MKFFRFNFLCLMLFLGMALVGQDDKAQDIMISPAGDTIAIKPYPLSEITTNVENTYQEAKKISATLLDNKELETFDSVYSIAFARLDSLKQTILLREEYFSITDIDNILREWDTYSKVLNEYKDMISERVVILQDDLFEVQKMEKVWRLTLKTERASGTSEEGLASVKDVIEFIGVLSKEIKEKQNEALSKQNNITALRLIVDEATSFLSNKRKELQGDFFVQDSPVIWRASDSSVNLKSIKSTFNKTYEESSRNLELFRQTNKNNMGIHLLIFLLLWGAFYFLHKMASKIEKDENDSYSLDIARNVVSRYGLSALILALFSSIWVYDSLVSTVTDIIQLLYILIALVFLPGYIGKRIKTVLFLLLLLFFMNEVQYFFYGKVFFARILMIIEIGLAGWILYKIIDRSYVIANALKKYKWDWILNIMPIFYAFLLVSLISNIFGYVNLSLLLNDTVVKALLNLNILLLVILVLNRTIIIIIRSPFARKSNILRNDGEKIQKRLFLAVQIIGGFLWIRAILTGLGLWEGLVEWFDEVMDTTWVIGSSTIAIAGIISFFLVIIGTIIFYRIIKSLLNDELYPRVTFPRGVPGAISMIVGYIISAYGLWIALGAAGVDLSNFGLVAGALGVGIGFGLQGIVANFIAGLVLAFERPIQVGDTIEAGTVMGTVTGIGVRACTILTYEGSEVIVPNSSLITNDVINWTLTDRRKRRDINVNVAYGSDPVEVMDLIKRVANEHPNVLKVPAPWALFDGFGDSSLNFRVRIWTTMDTGMTTQSDVATKIYYALHDAGIEIPFPQQDVYLKSVPAELTEPKKRPGRPAKAVKPAVKKEVKKKEDDTEEAN